MSQHPRFFKKTIRDIDVRGKRILLRAEFNVPQDDQGNITSDFRIEQTLPTLEYLLERDCSIVILSKIGRPNGSPDPAFSLLPVAQKLTELLPEYEVLFQPSIVDDGARQASKKLRKKQILLLENIRFDPREAQNTIAFARLLKSVSGADYFVQDAFGMVHREETSTAAITQVLPSVAGLLVEKEYNILTKVMQHPEHPLVAVVGGAKISDKIGFIQTLLGVAESVLIGGAMANTFLQYKKHPVGKSLVEPGQDSTIEKIYHLAKPGQIVLPVDVAVAQSIEPTATRTEKSLDAVVSEDIILDIGTKTMQLFKEKLDTAATVLWNGTLGYAELPQFATGSEKIAKAMCHGSKSSVVGGGDTADFVLDYQSLHSSCSFTHISTGGGASLELLSGISLPGINALLDA